MQKYGNQVQQPSSSVTVCDRRGVQRADRRESADGPVLHRKLSERAFATEQTNQQVPDRVLSRCVPSIVVVVQCGVADSLQRVPAARRTR